jgi:hypothetical protein
VNIGAQVSHADCRATEEKFDRLRRMKKATPTASDVRQKFRHRLTEHPDGKWEVNLKTRKEMLEWREMKRPWNRTAWDVMMTEQAKVDRIKMSLGGDVREVPAHLASYCESRGLKVQASWGARRIRVTGEDYDPNRPLRSAAEIRGW